MCSHSARGSTHTSIASSASGCGASPACLPVATRKYCCPCRYSIFSPFALRMNPAMPSRSFSVLRVFRSNVCRQLRSLACGRHGWRFYQEQYASFPGRKRPVIARRNRQGENALADVLEIDPDDGVLLCRVLGLLCFVWLLGVLGLLLVAFRGQRRGEIFCEHGHVYAARNRPLNARHVQPAGAQRGVGARREVEILPVFVK